MIEARQFSYITKEIVEKGSIEIHSTEEDMVKLSEVNIYNEYMKECRHKMRELFILRNYYLFVTSILSILFMFAKYTPILILPQEKEVFVRLIVEIILIVVYIFINCHTFQLLSLPLLISLKRNLHIIFLNKTTFPHNF